MEHIIQIGVSIDDNRIEKAVIESAKTALTQELRANMFSNSRWDDKFSATTERIVKEALGEWKDEIIEEAAKIVADGIKRSKAYREKVKEITNDV